MRPRRILGYGVTGSGKSTLAARISDATGIGWTPRRRPHLGTGLALDYPRWLSLGLLLRRTIVRTVTRRPICNGNVETLRETLSRDSIVAWHFRTFREKHACIAGWVADPAGPAVRRGARGPRVPRRPPAGA